MMHSKKKKKPSMYMGGGKMKKASMYKMGGMVGDAAAMIKKAMNKKRKQSAKGQPMVDPKKKGIKVMSR
jgi:hypothetical protein